MSGNGTSKKKIATKAAAAMPTITRFFSARLPIADHRLEHDGEHRRLEAEEQRLDDADIAESGIEPAQRHDRDDAGQHEQDAGDEAAPGAVQQPADVDGELLRLGAGQQHAVVERVQEPRLADPALLLDQDAVHDRDLAGRAAEAERGDPRPDPHGLARTARHVPATVGRGYGVPRRCRRAAIGCPPQSRFLRKYS